MTAAGQASIVRVRGASSQKEQCRFVRPLEETERTMSIDAIDAPAKSQRPGMKATDKLSAYEFGLYGGMEGTVQNISPDTLEEERRTQPAQEPYYRVLVKTDQPGLLHQGKVLPVIPGMVATVEVLTGQRTVWDYMLRPIFKGQEALRER